MNLHPGDRQVLAVAHGPILLAMSASLALLACGTEDPAGPDARDTPNQETLPGGVVASEPQSVVPASIGISSVGGASVSWVAFPVGTFPLATAAVVRNLRTGDEVSGAVVEGGLDPIAIPASVGDTAEVRILSGDTQVGRVEIIIPPDRPPIVVRGEPPAGRVKVPINAFAMVTFSEPMAAVSLTSPGAFHLEGPDGIVSGEVEVLDGGLRAWFLPDEALRPGQVYSIVVETQARDLAGDALQETFRTTFQTGEGPGFTGPGTLILARHPPNPTSYRDGYGLALEEDGKVVHLLGPWVEWDHAFPPGFSRDGSMATWWRWSSPRYELLTADLSTGSVRALLDVPIDNLFWTHFSGPRPGRWSFDGSWIAIDEPLAGVLVLQADGTDARRLSDDPRDRFAAWSPQGDEILVARRQPPDRVDVRASLLRMDVETGSAEVAFQSVEPQSVINADWSPDGRQIAVTLNDELWILSADGDTRPRLIATGLWRGLVQQPRWSPNGAWLAVQCPDPAGGPRLAVCVVRPDGTDYRGVAEGDLVDWIPGRPST